MEPGRNGTDGPQRTTMGLVLVLIVETAFLGWALYLGSTDPQGIGAATALAREEVSRLEPLYGAVWTPGWSLDWSPDGTWVALTGRDFVTGVSILDVATGQTVQQFDMQADGYAVRWSPDGQHIAVGAGDYWMRVGSVYIYSSEGELEHHWDAQNIPGAINDVGGVDWSPDGTRLVTAQGGRFAIWDVATETAIVRNDNVSVDGWTADWSPDGRRIAFGSLGGTIIVDASDGAVLAQASDGRFDARAVAWSRDGTRIATASAAGCASVVTSDGLTVWSREYTGDPCDTIWPAKPSWGPSDRLLAIPNARGILIVEPDTGDVLRTLVFPVGRYGPGYGLALYATGDSHDFDVAWSPNGNLLASTGSMTHPSFRLWGIRRSPVGAVLIPMQLAIVLGLPFALKDEFRALLLRSVEPVRRQAKARPPFALGGPLLLFAYGTAALQAAALNLVGLVYGGRVVPPLGWFVLTMALSALVSAAAVAFSLFAFRVLAWDVPRGISSPQIALVGRILGLSLLPVLWTAALSFASVEALLATGLPLPSFLYSAIVAVFMGSGLVLATTLVSNAAVISFPRALATLIGSTVAYIAAVVGIAVGSLEILSSLEVTPPPEARVYGFTFLFNFGLSPYLVALAALAISAVTGAFLVHPPRGLLFLYSRLTRQDILNLNTRRQVIEYVRDHPGVHFRELLRSLPMGSGSLHYHLYVLEREGFLIPRREGKYRRFFVAPGRQPSERLPST